MCKIHSTGFSLVYNYTNASRVGGKGHVVHVGVEHNEYSIYDVECQRCSW